LNNKHLGLKHQKSHGKNFDNDMGTNLFNFIIKKNMEKYKQDIALTDIHTFSSGQWVGHSGTESIHCKKNWKMSAHLYMGSWIDNKKIESIKKKKDTMYDECLIGDSMFEVEKKLMKKIYSKNISITPKLLGKLLSKPPPDNEIDIYMICRNNQKYLSLYFPKIKRDIEKYFKTMWYIYEDGSTDLTKKLLKHYFKHPNNKLKKELDKYHKFSTSAPVKRYEYMQKNYTTSKPYVLSLNRPQSSYKSCKNCQDRYRISHIANARNNCIRLSQQIDILPSLLPYPKWCLLIDTDVVFDYESTISKLFIAANNYPDGVMFCAKTDTVIDNERKMSDKDTKYKDSNNNIFTINSYYDSLALDYGMYLHNHRVIDDNFRNLKCGVYKALTAFGGVVLIRKEVLNLSYWSHKCVKSEYQRAYKKRGYRCEHHSFCESVRKFGEIYIVLDACAHWMMDNGYTNNESMIPEPSEHVLLALKNKKLLGYSN